MCRHWCNYRNDDNQKRNGVPDANAPVRNAGNCDQYYNRWAERSTVVYRFSVEYHIPCSRLLCNCKHFDCTIGYFVFFLFCITEKAGVRMAIKRIGYMCKIHLKELFRTPIFYAYLCLFFVYFYQLNKPAIRLQQEVGIQFNAFGYTVGVFSNYLPTLVFGLGAVMLFSDLPLIRENALFESTRCSRNTWVLGRVLYIFCISIFYTAFMLIICILTCGGKLNDFNTWGKLLNTYANNYSLGDYAIPIELGLPVTTRFTPFQGLALTMLMGSLAIAVIGQVMFILSLCCNRTAALFSGSILAVLDFLISLKLPFWYYHISPLSMVRLSIICNPDMPYYPTITEGILTLIISNVVCICLSLLVSHFHKHFASKILQEQY